MPRVGGTGGTAAAAMRVVQNKRLASDEGEVEDPENTFTGGHLNFSEQLKIPRHKQKLRAISEVMKQDKVRKAYKNHTIQWSIASLIAGNFISNCIEKQIDPWGLHYSDTWEVIEFVWNVIFVLELVWNMYGSWYISEWHGHFLSSGWNLFDLLVVGISVPAMLAFIGIGGGVSGGFGMLRMLRAFRILRLFRRIESLNKIIVSLAKALPGLLNAGLVMLLVMCICAWARRLDPSGTSGWPSYRLASPASPARHTHLTTSPHAESRPACLSPETQTPSWQ